MSLRNFRFLLNLVCLMALCVTAESTRAASPAGPEYRLLPGDQLEISVWKETDLQKAVTVTPDGKVSFPLIGIVDASGKTLTDLRAEIEKRLVTYIPEPVVTVSVRALAGRVYVIGQVARSGALEINPRINVLQALALAGGLTPFAKGDDIIIMRGNDMGERRTLPFKFGQVSQGRNLEQNVMLESGDVIIVP